MGSPWVETAIDSPFSGGSMGQKSSSANRRFETIKKPSMLTLLKEYILYVIIYLAFQECWTSGTWDSHVQTQLPWTATSPRRWDLSWRSLDLWRSPGRSYPLVKLTHSYGKWPLSSLICPLKRVIFHRTMENYMFVVGEIRSINSIHPTKSSKILPSGKIW